VVALLAISFLDSLLRTIRKATVQRTYPFRKGDHVLYDHVEQIEELPDHLWIIDVDYAGVYRVISTTRTTSRDC
jgi:hypothetical protein